MVEPEISYKYKHELWQKQKYHRIQKRIMVEPEISYKYKHELWQKQKYHRIQKRIYFWFYHNSCLYLYDISGSTIIRFCIL